MQRVYIKIVNEEKGMKVLIVIPCYNEEEVLPKTLEVLGNLIKTIKVKTDADTELLLVDDVA